MKPLPTLLAIPAALLFLLAAAPSHAQLTGAVDSTATNVTTYSNSTVSGSTEAMAYLYQGNDGSHLNIPNTLTSNMLLTNGQTLGQMVNTIMATVEQDPNFRNGILGNGYSITDNIAAAIARGDWYQNYSGEYVLYLPVGIPYFPGQKSEITTFIWEPMGQSNTSTASTSTPSATPASAGPTAPASTPALSLAAPVSPPANFSGVAPTTFTSGSEATYHHEKSDLTTSSSNFDSTANVAPTTVTYTIPEEDIIKARGVGHFERGVFIRDRDNKDPYGLNPGD